MFYTYITTNMRNGTLYIGQTDDIGKRMEEHKRGRYKGFAHDKNCTRLVWVKEHASRAEAFQRERQMKAWRRNWKIQLIEKDNPHWLDIANMNIWPIPQGKLFTEIRAQAMKDGMKGERNPRPYVRALQRKLEPSDPHASTHTQENIQRT